MIVLAEKEFTPAEVAEGLADSWFAGSVTAYIDDYWPLTATVVQRGVNSLLQITCSEDKVIMDHTRLDGTV